MKRLLTRSSLVACLALGTMEAQAANQPPQQNLAAARQLVYSIVARVQNLIARAQGHGGGDDGHANRCESARTRYQCSELPGCAWNGIRVGRCIPATPGPRINLGATRDDLASGITADQQDDVPENDFAGALALQGMGSGLNSLGQAIDLANANYYTPAFWGYWQQACQGAQNLIVANQGAKVAASLPAQGFISGNDFVPIDQELQAVRAQLWCP